MQEEQALHRLFHVRLTFEEKWWKMEHVVIIIAFIERLSHSFASIVLTDYINELK